MNRLSNFEVVVHRYRLGLVLTDDLPAAAEQGLVEGFDSPSLRQLAAGNGLDFSILSRLFLQSIEELRISELSREETGLALAKHIAAEIIRGTVTPYQGARQIWQEIDHRVNGLSELTVFAGLASEYEDDEPRREQYAKEIVTACHRLLSQLHQASSEPEDILPG